MDKTNFSTIYDSFWDRVTDDMYMEMTPEETREEARSLLLNAIPYFEFPKFDIFDYTLLSDPDTDIEKESFLETGGGFFNCLLTKEEINILSMYMVVEWFSRQIAITDLTRMRYSGSDFKFTSQANHMAKLKVMMDDYKRNGLHLQRLYGRRTRTADGGIQSAMSRLASEPSYGYKISE